VNTCIFCKIISGEHPAAVVFETDATICFLDHRPLFPGHVLVVPRAHHETIEDLPQELLGPLFGVVQRASRAVRTTMEAPGSFVAANNKVSQSVPHFHVHVVPRSPGDGLRGFFWPRNPYDDDAHLEEVRGRIADAFRLGR
jgi:histidine triad (HIT) family protein